MTIVRDYERKILLRETEELSRALSQSTTFSSHLGRVGELLRSVMRTLGGEDTDLVPPPPDPSSSAPNNRDEQSTESSEAANSSDDAAADAKYEAELAAAEWALERESELARLEQENALLRQLAAEHFNQTSDTGSSGSGPLPELPRLSNLPKVPARTLKGKLGGRDVGPFGMYKKFDE